MNITTNYTNLSQPNVRNHKLQSKQSTIQSPVQQNYQPIGQVQFTGLEKIIKPVRRLLQSREANNNFDGLLQYAASITGRKEAAIEKQLIGKSQRRIKFYASLVEKYNRQNFYAKPEQKESKEIIEQLFESITSPSTAHFRFINNSKYNLTESKKIFEQVGNKPKKINKIAEITADLSGVQHRNPETGMREPFRNAKELTLKLLDSPNAEEYISNYDKYRPFLHKHIAEKDVVAKLDVQVGAKTFDSNAAHKNNELDNLFVHMQEAAAFNKENLFKEFSEQGNKIITFLDSKIAIRSNKMSKEDGDALLNIYRTTTKENLDARGSFIENCYHNCGKRDEFPQDEMQNLDKLFTMMDNNPQVMKFIKKMSVKSTTLKESGNYLRLLEEVEPSILTRDVGIISGIANKYYHQDQTEKILEFYRTEPQNIFGRLYKKFTNLFQSKPVEENKFQPLTMEEFNKMVEEVSIRPVAKEKVAETVTPTVEITKNTLTEISTPITSEVQKVATEAVKAPKKSRLNFKQFVEKQPSAKKLVVINDVNNLIEKKLGKNVYTDQSKTYAKNATKIRLSLMPEIFESIKDTRTVARQNGTFNRRTTVKNEDALELYREINGKNKRLVNYMLKVRNADGTRKYDIRDIVRTLNEIKVEAKQQKTISTKENPFTPKHERAMYSAFVNEQIAQYGKLQQSKTKK